MNTPGYDHPHGLNCDCRFPARDAEDVRHPGKVHRYKVTGFWGRVPDQIKVIAQEPDGYCVDFWRGQTTTWELMDRTGEISGGWSGSYAGISPAAARTDGSGCAP